MTDFSRPQSTNWSFLILGICGFGALAFWYMGSVNSTTSVDQANSVALEGPDDDAEEVAVDDSQSSDATDRATTVAATSADGKPDVSTPDPAALANPVGAKTAGSTTADSSKSKPPVGQITLLVPNKKFRKEGPNKASRVGFDDIDIELVLNTKELTVDLPKVMPDWLKQLNGKRIRLRGYMHPGSAFQSEGIKRFIFCRDTSACCFGPNPTIYYLITTTMRSGTSVDYIDREALDIEGVFRIDPVMSEKAGKIAEFYHLDDAQLVRR